MSLRQAMLSAKSRSPSILLLSQVRSVLYPSTLFLTVKSMAMPNRGERMHPYLAPVLNNSIYTQTFCPSVGVSMAVSCATPTSLLCQYPYPSFFLRVVETRFVSCKGTNGTCLINCHETQQNSIFMYSLRICHQGESAEELYTLIKRPPHLVSADLGLRGLGCGSKNCNVDIRAQAGTQALRLSWARERKGTLLSLRLWIYMDLNYASLKSLLIAVRTPQHIVPRNIEVCELNWAHSVSWFSTVLPYHSTVTKNWS